jgi:hypothetical protein
MTAHIRRWWDRARLHQIAEVEFDPVKYKPRPGEFLIPSDFKYAELLIYTESRPYEDRFSPRLLSGLVSRLAANDVPRGKIAYLVQSGRGDQGVSPYIWRRVHWGRDL